jgi:hypothetical protein
LPKLKNTFETRRKGVTGGAELRLFLLAPICAYPISVFIGGEVSIGQVSIPAIFGNFGDFGN